MAKVEVSTSNEEILEMLEDLLPEDFEIQDWQLRVLRNMLVGAWDRGVVAGAYARQENVQPVNPYGPYR